MAKIRGIKPEIWTDEDFIELSPYARLLFIGLWNWACDNGHLQDKSKQLKVRILPGDDVSCAGLLDELATSGLINRGGGWIEIPNLPHHQKLDARWFKTCDHPDCEPPDWVLEKRQQMAAKRDSHRETRRGSDETRLQQDVARRDVDVDVEGDMRGEDVDMNIESAPATRAPDATRDDVERVCQHLVTKLVDTGMKKPPTVTDRWRKAARLMLDNDQVPEANIIKAIDWAMADDFWSSNILSMPKLREKYEVLRRQAQRPKAGATKATPYDPAAVLAWINGKD